MSHPAAAQEVVLRGLVLGASTHQPIANAQVGIGGNKLGTSTNAEGRFALRVLAAYQASELEVALLGYRRCNGHRAQPGRGAAHRADQHPGRAGHGGRYIVGHGHYSGSRGAHRAKIPGAAHAPHGLFARPLRGRVGLGYVQQAVGRSLSTFNSSDAGLQIVGTRLAAKSLALALQPKLGLALELGRQLDLAAYFGYLLPLRTRAQLRLQETDEGFFSVANTAILPLPAAEAQVYVAGQWLLTLSLGYRLQRR